VKVVKVTSKGQVTIPVEAREKLGIGEDTYLEVSVEGSSVRFRKRAAGRALDDDDPIWDLIGSGRGGARNVSRDHDRVLAEVERRRWRESS
jgi:transcriptional pleiotropic regulator of transition state genes